MPVSKDYPDFLVNLKNPGFFEIEIHCLECKRALFQIKILQHNKKEVMSTEQHRCKGVPKDWDFENENKCPLCNKQYFTTGKRGERIHMTLDMYTGLKRLT